LSFGRVNFQRTEPHPSDPSRAIYQNWLMVYPVPGLTETVHDDGGPSIPMQTATRQVIKYGEQGMGLTVGQDLHAAHCQQLGFASRGFRKAYLTGQENRIHQFHDTINDYIEGRR
jgi:hypothetical protein